MGGVPSCPPRRFVDPTRRVGRAVPRVLVAAPLLISASQPTVVRPLRHCRAPPTRRTCVDAAGVDGPVVRGEGRRGGFAARRVRPGAGPPCTVVSWRCVRRRHCGCAHACRCRSFRGSPAITVARRHSRVLPVLSLLACRLSSLCHVSRGGNLAPPTRLPLIRLQSSMPVLIVQCALICTPGAAGACGTGATCQVREWWRRRSHSSAVRCLALRRGGVVARPNRCVDSLWCAPRPSRPLSP